MRSKKIINRLTEPVILFGVLLVVTAIAYAATSWAPGSAPLAAPGNGNVAVDNFWTKNGPDKIFLDASVGIGTDAPQYKLQVYQNDYYISSGGVTTPTGDTAGGFLISTDPTGYGGAYLAVNSQGRTWLSAGGATNNNGDNQKALVLNSGQGNVGIGHKYGTQDPSQKLEVDGGIKASSFLYSSDQRSKQDIQTITGLDIINQLRGVRFDWKEDGRSDIGLIAQEVEKVMPELVHTDPYDGMKSVEYANLVAPLIEAIKEQQQQIEDLQNQLNELQTLVK